MVEKEVDMEKLETILEDKSAIEEDGFTGEVEQLTQEQQEEESKECQTEA